MKSKSEMKRIKYQKGLRCDNCKHWKTDEWKKRASCCRSETIKDDWCYSWKGLTDE